MTVRTGWTVWMGAATLGIALAGCSDGEMESSREQASADPVQIQNADDAGEAASELQVSGEVTWFPMPVPDSGPTTLAVGPEGDIWFTLSSANAIGRMKPNGAGLAYYYLPTAESSPRIISLGSDGNLWFSQHNAGQIGRITPAGEITEFSFSTPGSQPRAIALGSDGNIWVGLFAAGSIARVTPAGEITEFDIPTEDSGPRALASGPDGNVWFSEFKAGKIGRITPDGEIIEFDLPRPDRGPGDITTGTDGNLWFVELSGTIDGISADGNRVGRITPGGDIREFDIPSEDGTPINIAVGPDRNVWYTKGNALGRVTPEGEIREFPVADGAARVVGLTAGSDRQPPERLVDRLWFTDPLNNRVGYLSFE